MRLETSRKLLTAACYSTRPLKSRVLFIIVWMSEIFTAQLKFVDACGCRLQSLSKGHPPHSWCNVSTISNILGYLFKRLDSSAFNFRSTVNYRFFKEFFFICLRNKHTYLVKYYGNVLFHDNFYGNILWLRFILLFYVSHHRRPHMGIYLCNLLMTQDWWQT